MVLFPEEIDWSKVPEIPSHVPYLLIGSGIASIEAFKAIKTTDPKAKVSYSMVLMLINLIALSKEKNI
jgi:hypothetical protein